MNALQLSDPDRRRALVGVLLHLDEMGAAAAALCRYMPGGGIDAITTRPAVACVPWLETVGSNVAAYALATSPEAGRSVDAVELALDVINAAERMDVPLLMREAGEQWTPSYFTYLTNYSAETTAPERAAAQLVMFRAGWEAVKAAGESSHRKARAHFQGEQSYDIAR